MKARTRQRPAPPRDRGRHLNFQSVVGQSDSADAAVVALELQRSLDYHD